MIKLKGMIWMGDVTKKKACRILMGKTEGNRTLQRQRHGWITKRCNLEIRLEWYVMD
jgi:hypothetical protein